MFKQTCKSHVLIMNETTAVLLESLADSHSTINSSSPNKSWSRIPVTRGRAAPRPSSCLAYSARELLWASRQHGRQASRPGKKTPKRPGKLGRSKTWAKLESWNTNLKFSKVQARALFGGQTCITMTEDHVSSLFYCYSVCLITIKLNYISQSDQSSWMTFCESLSSDRK
jgi:hypothetical protein